MFAVRTSTGNNFSCCITVRTLAQLNNIYTNSAQKMSCRNSKQQIERAGVTALQLCQCPYRNTAGEIVPYGCPYSEHLDEDDLCVYIFVEWMSHVRELVGFDSACCNRVLRCRYLLWLRIRSGLQLPLDLRVIPLSWIQNRQLVLRNLMANSRFALSNSLLLTKNSTQTMRVSLKKYVVDIVKLLEDYPALRELTVTSHRELFIFPPLTFSLESASIHTALTTIQLQNVTFPGFLWMDLMICFAKLCPALTCIALQDCDLLPIELLLFLTRKSFFPHLKHLVFQSYEDNIVGDNSSAAEHRHRLAHFVEKINQTFPTILSTESAGSLFSYDPTHYVTLTSLTVLPYYKPTDELSFFPLFVDILLHILHFACQNIHSLELLCCNFCFEEAIPRWEALIRRNWMQLQSLKCFYSFFFTDSIMKAMQETCLHLHCMQWNTCSAPKVMDYDEQRLALTRPGFLSFANLSTITSLMIHGEVLHHEIHAPEVQMLLQRLKTLQIQSGQWHWKAKEMRKVLQSCLEVTELVMEHAFSLQEEDSIEVFQSICSMSNPHLKYFSFKNTLQSTCIASDNVVPNAPLERIETLLQGCLLSFPALQSLTLHGIPMTTMCIQRIVTQCPQLSTVDVCSDFGGVDLASVSIMLLPHLQQLHLIIPQLHCPLHYLQDLLQHNLLLRSIRLKTLRNSTAQPQYISPVDTVENISAEEIATLQTQYRLRVPEFIVNLA